MAQLNRLLPVQLVLLPREPEGQKGVPTPAGEEKHFSKLDTESAGHQTVLSADGPVHPGKVGGIDFNYNAETFTLKDVLQLKTVIM